MRVALGAAGAERDAELGARQMPREPRQVGVGERESGLARAFADDQLRRRRRPRAARVARLVGDEHDLEPPPLGLGGDLAEAKRLLRRSPTSATTRSTSSSITARFSGSRSPGISTVAFSVTASSDAVSAPGERQRPVEHRDRARARRPARSTTSQLIAPLSDGPAQIPISSPRWFDVLRALALNTAALRALARNSRSRWVLITLIRICGKLTREVDQRLGVELERVGHRARRRRSPCARRR